MPDPYMEAMMRGDFSKKKKETEDVPVKKNRFQVAIDKNIQQILDMFSYEEEGESRLESAVMKRAKLENELNEAFKNAELSNYIDVAISTLVDEGKDYIEPIVFEGMIVDFAGAINYLNSLDLDNLPEEDIDQILHIHPETIEGAFKVAIAKFEEEQYDKSLALFVFLTLLQAHDYDYWYRTGIVAQHTEKYDLALKAYENAMNLNPDSIGARLFTAECLLKMNRKSEAKEVYEEMKQLHKEKPFTDKWLQIYEHVSQQFL